MMLLTGCYDSELFFRSNQEIQTYAIALINALFLKAPEDRRQVSEQHSLHSALYWRKGLNTHTVLDTVDIAGILIMFHPQKHPSILD